MTITLITRPLERERTHTHTHTHKCSNVVRRRWRRRHDAARPSSACPRASSRWRCQVRCVSCVNTVRIAPRHTDTSHMHTHTTACRVAICAASDLCTPHNILCNVCVHTAPNSSTPAAYPFVSAQRYVCGSLALPSVKIPNAALGVVAVCVSVCGCGCVDVGI